MEKEIQISLRELRNGSHFRVRKNGMIWIKQNEQGMNNCVTYARSLEMIKTRCQHLNYRHRYLKTDDIVFFVTEPEKHSKK